MKERPIDILNNLEAKDLGYWEDGEWHRKAIPIPAPHVQLADDVDAGILTQEEANHIANKWKGGVGE